MKLVIDLEFKSSLLYFVFMLKTKRVAIYVSITDGR